MQSKRKNVDKRKIFLWCAAAGIVLCAVLFCLWHNRTALAEQRVERALSVTVSQPEPRLAQEDNTETGAWITVPGTNIDAPVQQASDNDYYLRRDTAGNADVHGCVFADYCFACAVAALGGVDRRLGRHIVLHVCVSLSASTHRRLPRQNAARLSARFRLLPVRDAVFIGTYARPGCFRVYRGIFLPVNRTVRPCQSPGTAPERERTESTSAAHLHSAADCGRPYGSSFIFPPRLGCLYSVRCFCGCVITCNLVARLWSV